MTEIKKTEFDKFIQDDKQYIFSRNNATFIKSRVAEKLDIILIQSFKASEFECVGIYDRENQKLYGSELTFDGRFYHAKSTLLVGNFPYNELKQRLATEIEQYVNNHYIELKELVEPTYLEKHQDWIESSARTAYIKGENLSEHKHIYNNELNLNVLIKFMAEPDNTINALMDEWLNYKGYGDRLINQVMLGDAIVYNECLHEKYNAIVNNPNNEYSKRKEIYDSIKNLNAVNINIRLKSREITEKMSREHALYIIASDSNYELDAEDIKSISFRGKDVYIEHDEIKNTELDEIEM